VRYAADIGAVDRERGEACQCLVASSSPSRPMVANDMAGEAVAYGRSVPFGVDTMSFHSIKAVININKPIIFRFIALKNEMR
jgi:hypothetical protein